MNITVDEGLRAYIDPLTSDEYAALERSLLAEGCRDALVLWGELLVDGHNRYGICQKHGIAFQTVQNSSFKSMEDVHLWMIDNHLGRRSVSDFQRGVLALRKKEILAARVAQASLGAASASARAGAVSGDDGGPGGSQGLGAGQAGGGEGSGAGGGDAAGVAAGSGSGSGSGAGSGSAGRASAEPPWSREEVARAARVSSATLGQIEKIQRTAAPELVGAVKSGVISINAAAAVASLPSEKQVAAVAGGKKELREAARQVREARAPAKPKPEVEGLPDDATPEQVEIHRLMALVAELKEERDQLKKKVQNLTIALAEARP